MQPQWGPRREKELNSKEWDFVLSIHISRALTCAHRGKARMKEV